MTILLIDTETTGLEPANDSIVEIAAVPLNERDGKWSIGTTYTSLVKPTTPIQIKALAVHHITEAMVDDALSFADALAASPLADAAVTHVAAHNAQFDSGFLPQVTVPWVCTYRCAMHLWPDAPGHSNSVLRYWLPDLNDELRATQAGQLIMQRPPHRALVDAYVSAHLLKRMLCDHTVDELLRLTTAPVLLKTVYFGKHKGKNWSEVEKDYLRWIVKSGNFNEDVNHTAKYYMEGGTK